MKVHKASIEQFIDWARTKSGKYQIENNCHCPMAEFARERYGFDKPRAGFNAIRNNDMSYDNDMVKIPNRIFRNIVKSKTYESLVESLETSNG